MFYLDTLKAFAKHKIPYAIVGGWATALHGAVRGTVDLDLSIILDEKNLSKTQKLLETLGLKSRIPVDASEIANFREEYIKNRNLIAWSFVNPSNPSQVVDILLTHDLRKLKVKEISTNGAKLKVVDIEDLIAMKKSSGRKQDLADVDALERILNSEKRK